MSSATGVLLVLLVCLLFASPVSAFGAGEVPGGNDFNGYVWRHGDIVEVLKYLPVSFVTHYRFSKIQRKQVYFGNWLRDFSQVIDATLLDNVPEPILRAIVSVMGFMEFGFATDEFDVTRDRLGCYTHVEHIDNPKGYPDNAKEIDPRLRGPVDPRELEFDPKTGMKNYIANSGKGWATSADYIREQLELCIEKGRQGRHKDPSARKESLIHLGAALHTLEDFSAHSNFTELCLNELGEADIFAFVGNDCMVSIPTKKGRKVAPVVTGTFGMLDIFQSILGEADDMAILQSKGTLSELEGVGEKLNYGEMAFNQLFDMIKSAVEALSSISTDNSPLIRQLEAVGVIARKAQEDPSEFDIKKAALIKNPNLLWQSIEPIFYLHDRISKWLQEGEDETIEHPPDKPVNELGEYTNQLVFKFLSLTIESSIKELRNAVKAAKEKVDGEAAKSSSAEIYQDGSASDPSHSDLSKDHFSNLLNQPAGLVATVTTNWTTQQIVKCWDNPKRDSNATIDEILSILHHPAFPRNKTPIQQYMFKTVEKWWNDNSPEQKDRLRRKLSKDSVRSRGHEDHDLTLKDFRGKHKGVGDFPGSRPSIREPPKKAPLLSWAVNDTVDGINKTIGTVKKSMTDPVGAAQDIVTGIGNLTSTTVTSIATTAMSGASMLARGVGTMVVSIASWISNVAYGLLPLGKRET